MVVVYSFIFAKSQWSITKAKRWLERRNITHKTLLEINGSMYFKLNPPVRFYCCLRLPDGVDYNVDPT